jgi:hypothetical protein
MSRAKVASQPVLGRDPSRRVLHHLGTNLYNAKTRT